MTLALGIGFPYSAAGEFAFILVCGALLWRVVWALLVTRWLDPTHPASPMSKLRRRPPGDREVIDAEFEVTTVEETDTRRRR